MTPAPCGTYAGLQRHIRDGEEPCRACKAARNGYIAGHRHSYGGALHGSHRTLLRHYAAGEEPCELCKSWLNGFALGIAELGRGRPGIPRTVEAISR